MEIFLTKKNFYEAFAKIKFDYPNFNIENIDIKVQKYLKLFKNNELNDFSEKFMESLSNIICSCVKNVIDDNNNKVENWLCCIFKKNAKNLSFFEKIDIFINNEINKALPILLKILENFKNFNNFDNFEYQQCFLAKISQNFPQVKIKNPEVIKNEFRYLNNPKKFYLNIKSFIISLKIIDCNQETQILNIIKDLNNEYREYLENLQIMHIIDFVEILEECIMDTVLRNYYSNKMDLNLNEIENLFSALGKFKDRKKKLPESNW